MVGAPSLFIVYEFLKQFLPELDTLFSDIYSLFILAGFILLMAALALLFRHEASKSSRVFYPLAIMGAILSSILFIVSAFMQTHGSIDAWAKTVLNLEPRELHTFGLLLVLGTSSLATAVLSFFRSKKPTYDSTLSSRQLLQAYAVLSGISTFGLALWYWFPDVFFIAFISFIVFFEGVSIIFFLYDPLLYLLSKIAARKQKAALASTPGKINRFAIIAYAHNEEKVIGNLIDSAYASEYPRSKYDIFVLCDTCHDRTLEVVVERGAVAMEFASDEHQGKGYALRWMASILENMRRGGNEYDAYVILNADNLINSQYLSEINVHLNQGYELMQTYLSCKNPNDTWISKCYSIQYWLSNTQYQKAHSALNLSAQAIGGGMIIRPDTLEKLGWDPDSLTEDTVFTVEYLLETNQVCHWVHNAHLYGESPLTLRASTKQRTRGMQGHMDAMAKYTRKLLVSGIRNFSFKQIDMAFYLLRPLMSLLVFIFYLVRIAMLLTFPDSYTSASIVMSFPLAITLIAICFAFQLYALYKEGYLRCILWLPLQFIFSFTWYKPIFRGFVKRHEHMWIPTFHARDLTIGNLRKDLLSYEAQQRLSGLDNLHVLPLGQILLKAAVITGSQLNEALIVQREKGGFLGNILVETKALDEDILEAYVRIQQVMRETTENDSLELQKLQLGQILLQAELITEEELKQTLAYQQKHGGQFGEDLVELQIIPQDLLRVFLEVQDLIGLNYLNTDRASDLVKGMIKINPSNRELEMLLLSGGLISRQQLEVARGHQKQHDEQLMDTLVYLGYVSPRTLETIKCAISSYAKEDQSFDSFSQN